MTGERGPAGLARDNLDVHYGPGSRTSRTAGARTDSATGAWPRDPSQLGTYSTGVPQQKGAGQPTARLSRRHRGSEAGGLIHPLWPSPPSKEVPPAGHHTLDGSAGGPATRKQWVRGRAVTAGKHPHIPRPLTANHASTFPCSLSIASASFRSQLTPSCSWRSLRLVRSQPLTRDSASGPQI